MSEISNIKISKCQKSLGQISSLEGIQIHFPVWDSEPACSVFWECEGRRGGWGSGGGEEGWSASSEY